MKINTKILSIPPYVSTSWKNVVSLHIESKEGLSILAIGLVNGSTIEIPGLEKSVLQATFAAHEKFLEQETSTPLPQKDPPPLVMGQFPGEGSILSLPLNMSPLNVGLDGNMANLLQHNPDAADSPDLPEEVIVKVSQLSNVMGLDQGAQLPKAEPHCNCTHCQVMRALQNENEETKDQEGEPEEEEISDEDLLFREWDIEQSDDNLYIVTNPFNKKEQYNVYLGNPVGCTCGESNCEHIRTVLNS